MLGGEVIQQRLFMINGNEIHGWSRQGSGLTEQGHRGCDVEEANLVPLWRNAAHAERIATAGLGREARHPRKMNDASRRGV